MFAYSEKNIHVIEEDASVTKEVLTYLYST